MNEITLSEVQTAESLNRRILARLEQATNLLHFHKNYWTVKAFEVCQTTHGRIDVTMEYDRDGDKEFLSLPAEILVMSDEELAKWAKFYLEEKQAEQERKLAADNVKRAEEELAQLKRLAEKYPVQALDIVDAT